MWRCSDKLNLIRHIFFHSFFVLIFYGAKSQEQLGINNSNYFSTSSIFLNPSSSADSKVYMQLNLVSAGASFFNNAAYLPWFSVWRLYTAKGQVQDPKISTLKASKFFYGNAFIDAPAFVMSKRNYGFGVFARARTIIDVRGIPYELADILLQQNPNPAAPNTKSINKRNLKVANLSWLEYGGNFSWIIKKAQKDLIAIGGNLKYITGINVAYLNFNHIKGFYNDTVLQIDEVEANLRYNQPKFNSGNGIGLDFGITYKKMLKTVENYFPNSEQSNCTNINYKYKLALSLRDAGYIHFKTNNTKASLSEAGTFRTDTGLVLTEDTITNSLNASLTHQSIWAGLPLNASVQFDWNFENGFYANATIVKNLLPNSLTGASASNLIAFTPRFEIKNFEVAMPITFQKFIYPQLGLAFRLRSFVLGFDNCIPLFFMKPHTYGLGVYTRLAVSLFKNPACNKRGRKLDDCPTSILDKDRAFKNKLNKVFKRKKKKK